MYLEWPFPEEALNFFGAVLHSGGMGPGEESCGEGLMRHPLSNGALGNLVLSFL